MVSTVFVSTSARLPADLPLDPGGHHDPAQVVAVHPVRDVVETVLEIDTDPGLRERPGELTRGRLRAVSYDGVHGLRQREPGTKRSDDQLKHIGELFAERCTARPMRRLRRRVGPASRREVDRQAQQRVDAL
jgi:hypothetical protein